MAAAGTIVGHAIYRFAKLAGACAFIEEMPVPARMMPANTLQMIACAFIDEMAMLAHFNTHQVIGHCITEAMDKTAARAGDHKNDKADARAAPHDRSGGP